jgi:hypothetical protein
LFRFVPLYHALFRFVPLYHSLFRFVPGFRVGQRPGGGSQSGPGE